MAALSPSTEPARAAEAAGFDLSVWVDGARRPELRGRGQTYVEALHGREYTLRLTNPLGRRVAVALAVDGLNTIDAKHTTARQAAKWVLGPYETIEIGGWQVSPGEARSFFFTGERRSYADSLGRTEDVGVIEAAFFRERQPFWARRAHEERRAEGGGASAPAPSMESARRDKGQDARAAEEDYAATGIGERVGHSVEWVDLDLERSPAAVLRLRYEYRPQLVRLGLLAEVPDSARLRRREAARGFEGSYCPDPAR